MRFEPLTSPYDPALADLIRHTLTAHDLALPGTAFADEGLNHLSVYYAAEPTLRRYEVLLDDAGGLLGGVGIAELPQIEGCAELQKLYLQPAARGRGLGRKMIAHIEGEASALGYRRIYLETHSNLKAAIRLYEAMGYRRVPRPDFVVHSAMDVFFQKEI